MRQPRFRAYSWTLHQLTPTAIAAAKSVDAVYLCFGVESGSDKLTPHLQGYVYFQQPKGLAAVKTLFQNKQMHLESSKGSPLQNRTYCSKEDGEFFEKGEIPQQGKRTDIDYFMDSVKERRLTPREMLTEHTSMYFRYEKMCDRANDIMHPPVDYPKYSFIDFL